MTEISEHPPALSRLRQLARAAPAAAPAAATEEVCELCGEAVPDEHRHMLDLQKQRLLCACRACTVLMDSNAAGGGHYRLIPDRSRNVVDFDLDELLWSNLRLPVDIAFFFHSTQAGRIVAFYPSPLGATESLLELASWDELEARNPILQELEADVEALLVHRANGAREHWLVPVDRAYALVGLIRTRWKGFNGGKDVWEEIDRFFADLRRSGKAFTKAGARVKVDRPVQQGKE